MNANALKALIAQLPVSQPVTDAFERRKPPTGTVWYTSQKDHLLGWLGDYDTAGAYARRNPGQDAKFFYTRFQCVQGLLWLAEALGEEEATLRRAILAVDAAGRNSAAQCGAFRRVVPWSRIEELIRHSEATPSQMTAEPAIKALVDRVRQAPLGQVLMPSAQLWNQLGLTGASHAARTSALALLRSSLRVTPLDRKDAFYLEWSDLGSRQSGRPTGHSRSARSVHQGAMPPAALDPAADHIRAVSIRQPYVELILRGVKDREYRSWSTTPGPTLLHASRTITGNERAAGQESGIDLEELPTGALVGVVDIVGVEGVEGDYAWVLARPRRFATPIPWKGAAAIMRVDMAAVRSALQGLSSPDQ